MTDAARHPLIGSTVAGYTLDSVRFVWTRATDFDASRHPAAGADAQPEPPSPTIETRRSVRRRPAGIGAEGRNETRQGDDRVRVRVWHAPDVAPGDVSPQDAQRRVGPRRSRWAPRIIRMARRFFHPSAGRAARVAGVAEGAVLSAEPPEHTRRRELDLAADPRIRSDVIPRPIALSATEPGIRAPFGGCEAALFPALGESFEQSRRGRQGAGMGMGEDSGMGEGTGMGVGSAAAVLIPLLNAVVELLEAGYQPQPLALGALARDVVGTVMVIDTDLLTVRREPANATWLPADPQRPRSDASRPREDALREDERRADPLWEDTLREQPDVPWESAAMRSAIPPDEALSALAPVVAELSTLVGLSDDGGPAGETLSARWAAWCEQIEGASAQLVSWHGETRPRS
jgi:hypothetical protein